jgi:hypothetical protein
MTNAIATPRQIDFIAKLVDERKATCGVTDVDAFMQVLAEQRLTKTGASALIDNLLSQKPDAKAVVADAAPVGAAQRRNGYAAKCERCGKQVPAQGGSLNKVGGRWVTAHFDGECPVDLQVELNQLLAEIPKGYYAIPFIGLDAARNDLTFLAVGMKDNGDRTLRHVVGGHGELDGMSIEWCRRAVAGLNATSLEVAAAIRGVPPLRPLVAPHRRCQPRPWHGPECATKLW